MKKFLKRIACFVVGLLLVLVLAYVSVDYIWNSESAENTIFIWGDSQAYQGINLEQLGQLTGKRVLSAARHGAGIYDFLVFAEEVPENATVIIALSRPVQLRRKEKDRNWSGISLTALFDLYKRNYSLYDISLIIKKNIKPAKLYLSHVKLYPYYDVLVLHEPISLFEKIYSKKPYYLDDKQALYIDGLQTLKKKHCRITLIEFPYYSAVQEIERRSAVTKYLEDFRGRVMALFDKHDIDAIDIDTAIAMYDLSHLNRYGATMVTKQLAEKMSHAKVRTLYIVRGRS